MPKPRLKQLVRESLRNVKSNNRSDDLVKLARDFEVFKARLRRMVEALAAEHKCLIMLNKSRLNVSYDYDGYLSPLVNFKKIKKMNE